MRRLSLPCALLLLAAPTFAADDVKVEVKETYWQRLADVSTVTLDSNRDPVFHLKGGYSFPKTGTFVAYREGGPWAPAYFDRAGRVWVLDRHRSKVHFWNGTQWETLDHHPVQLFDDSAGRMFLFDGKNVRVLGTDGKWAVEAITKSRHSEGVNFVESGKRVWLWGSREKPGSLEGMLGVWRFADGKWTHHDTTTGLPFDAVSWMHPLADGRFVLLPDRAAKGGESPPVFWHPERKLTDDETVVLRQKELSAGGGPLTGIDGTLYLNGARGFKGGWVTVSPKGESGFATRKELDDGRPPVARVNGRNVIFAKFGDPLPILSSGGGGFIGADRDGRYYFRAAERKGAEGVVTAVWPKHEKPGDVMRLEKEKIAVTRVVKDEVGKIWAEQEYGGGLLQWHGGKWIDTPVQPLFHPNWTARPASPWNDWTWNSAHLFRLHAKNGSVLVVRIRDTYQLEDPPGGGRVPPRPIRDPNFPHPAPPPPVPAGAEKPKYWLEAWLFRGGKWSGPTEVGKLFATESAALLADFPTTAGEMSFFAYVNDGTRLWAAFDGKVLTADKAGKVIETAWPREKPKNPLPYAMLSKMADGKVLLTEYGDGHTLSLSPEGKVAAEVFKMPGIYPARHPREWVVRWKLAKDNTLWYWTANVGGGGALMWHYREGKWTEKKGVGVPIHEDADGNSWCLPEPRYAWKFQLLVVNGTETKELTFAPDDQPLGFTTVPKGAAMWALGDRLYCLDTTGPGGKPVMRWRVLSESVFGYTPVVIDTKGTVLLGGFRGEVK